ncbi:hypothetical protein [Caenimonas sp. SL110]|uniref:hypothetical protein n=1 Tax=Caenimonas sp. SL110 TaxID=1450524 RepID=UPI00065352BC|nr:hypothetical protein [Caenimonas sp. SL110]
MDNTEIARARPDRRKAGGSWFRQVLGLAASPRGSNPATRDCAAAPPARKLAGSVTPTRTTPPHVHRFDACGWGHTVLVDSDGHGVIQVGDVLLSECAPVARGMWVDASRDFCLFTIRRKGGCTDLAICRRDDPSGGSILVHDWSPSRSLGICLTHG